MTHFRWKRPLTGALLLTALLAGPAWAAPVRLEVPDEPVTTQDDRRTTFVSGVIGDKLAAVTFTFTSCTTICPVLDGIFLQVQRKLPAALRGEVELVTVSIDPTTDIPARLKEHAREIGAGPAWTFVTGETTAINRILKALEVYTADIQEHPPTVFVVDGRSGEWTRLYGFPSAGAVVRALDGYRRARGDAG